MAKRYGAFGIPIGASMAALVAGFREMEHAFGGSATRIEKITAKVVGEEIHVAIFLDETEDAGIALSLSPSRWMVAPPWPDDTEVSQPASS